jgi:hypothetical protein
MRFANYYCPDLLSSCTLIMKVLNTFLGTKITQQTNRILIIVEEQIPSFIFASFKQYEERTFARGQLSIKVA